MRQRTNYSKKKELYFDGSGSKATMHHIIRKINKQCKHSYSKSLLAWLSPFSLASSPTSSPLAAWPEALAEVSMLTELSAELLLLSTDED
jgi:hypothetical protein